MPVEDLRVRLKGQAEFSFEDNQNRDPYTSPVTGVMMRATVTDASTRNRCQGLDVVIAQQFEDASTTSWVQLIIFWTQKKSALCLTDCDNLERVEDVKSQEEGLREFDAQLLENTRHMAVARFAKDLFEPVELRLEGGEKMYGLLLAGGARRLGDGS
ncbi:hypothetical protein BGZ75_009110, partial [Mortierella antarctica]